MTKILLVCGHGDGDCGAVGNGYQEQYLTREFAKILQGELQQYNNCICDIAPDSRNYFTYLRSHTFDFRKYDYVFEIHFNAGGGYGTEIWVTKGKKDIVLEKTLVNHISEYGEMRSRGVKYANFYVINKIKAQGVNCSLLEVCFIDSKADMLNYEINKYAMAKGLSKGFALRFGFTQKENNKVMNERLDKINERLTELENRLAVFNYIDDNMGSEYKPTIQKLVNAGFLKGDENGLALTEEMMRVLTILDRAGVFGE